MSYSSYGNQRPVYDTRTDQYSQSSSGGYDRGGYGTGGYGNQGRNVAGDIENVAIAFATKICQEIDRRVGSGLGEGLYRQFDACVVQFSRNCAERFQSFVDAAGRDDPIAIAGTTLAGLILDTCLRKSNPRFTDDIARYAPAEYDLICQTARDHDSIINPQRRDNGPRDDRSVGYGNQGEEWSRGGGDRGGNRNSGYGNQNGYGSRGQTTSLVNQSEPDAPSNGDSVSQVSQPNLAMLAMAAERDAERDNPRPKQSQLVEPGQHRDNPPDAVRKGAIQQDRAHGTSMLDWMKPDLPVEPEERRIVEPRPVSGSATFTPLNTTSTPVPAEPFQYGSDPVFNSMADKMQAAAMQRDLAAEHREATPMRGVEYVEARDLEVDGEDILFQPDHSDLYAAHTGTDGIMEDFDDVLFDPTDPKHDLMALYNFGARSLAFPEQCGGWKFYECEIDGALQYDRSISPWPMAYDAIHNVKLCFINPKGLLQEFVKPKYTKDQTMEMQDHIPELMIVATKGNEVNILELLTGTTARVNTKDNRNGVKENKAKGVEAVIATADRNAFDINPRNTINDQTAFAIKDKLEAERKTKIEGFNERRLTPVYMGPEGIKAMETFRHQAAAPATFDAFASKIPKALEAMPTAFVVEYTKRLTARFNDFLRNKMAMDFEIEDFFGDFFDAVAELEEQLGEATTADKLNKEFVSFSRMGKIMPRVAANYTDVLGTALATDDYVVFVTLMTTVAMPFSSTDEDGIVPDADVKYIGVAESQSPHLHKLLATVSLSAREVFNGNFDILRIITTDNRVFYVDIGAFSVEGDCYIVAHRNYQAELLS